MALATVRSCAPGASTSRDDRKVAEAISAAPVGICVTAIVRVVQWRVSTDGPNRELPSRPSREVVLWWRRRALLAGEQRVLAARTVVAGDPRAVGDALTEVI